MHCSKKKLPFLIMLLTLSGCTGKWEKIRPDAAEFSPTNTLCRDQSDKYFPVKNEVAQRTNYEYYEKKCDKSTDCDGKDYKKGERPVTESYVMDVNKDSRGDFYNNCMSQYGWEKHYF